MLFRSSGSDDAALRDSATLNGATADAGGTVTYCVYSDISCTTKMADDGTVTVTNYAVPNSSDVTTPGIHYWEASYSGNANNAAATSTVHG